jgi:hypothetical protein
VLGIAGLIGLALVAAGRPVAAQGKRRSSDQSGDAKDTTVKKPGEPGGPMDPERPIPFLIDHRSDLTLADSQITRLNLIQNRLDAADRAAQLAIDTLPPPSTKPIDWAHITPTQRDSLIAYRRAMSAANASLHDNALAARTEALAVLSADQQSRMRSVNQSIINKQIDASRPSSPSGGGSRLGAGQQGTGGRP